MTDASDRLEVHRRPDGEYVMLVVAGPFKSNAEAWAWADRYGDRVKIIAPPHRPNE
jgi:hypothetical protein